MLLTNAHLPQCYAPDKCPPTTVLCSSQIPTYHSAMLFSNAHLSPGFEKRIHSWHYKCIDITSTHILCPSIASLNEALHGQCCTPHGPRGLERSHRAAASWPASSGDERPQWWSCRAGRGAAQVCGHLLALSPPPTSLW